MQIFEVIELKEPPYMETKELFADISKEETVKDLIDNQKVLILIDHNEKRIWTYYGPKTSLKLQMFGGILARKFRAQLRLFYRISNMNEYSYDDRSIQKIFEQQVGPGRARVITREDYNSYTIPGEKATKFTDLCVHTGINKKDAIELLKSIPQPEDFHPKIILIGGDFYSYESELNSYITKIDEIKTIKKLGQIPNGFYFDNTYQYSIRLIIKDGKVQAVEYYIPEDLKVKGEQIKIPIFMEEKFHQPGEMNSIFNSMKIPEKLIEEQIKEQLNVNKVDKDKIDLE